MPDPHLQQALAVLAELVAGTAAGGYFPSPIYWAVAIVDIPVGTYPIIASSAGCGDYLPSRAFLPRTARLITRDPGLPPKWRDQYLGWTHPVWLVDAYQEELGERVYALRIAATASNDPLRRRPRCGGKFRAVESDELRGRAPEYGDGQYLHRLEAAHPQAAIRLGGIVQRAKNQAECCTQMAITVTETVLTAAAAETGQRVSLPVDDELWAAIKAGGVTVDDFHRWREESDSLAHTWSPEAPPRRERPEIYQPRDLGGPVDFYRHHYRSARIAELLELWAPDRNISWPGMTVADAIYCAIEGGFSDEIAAVIADVERHP